MIYFKCKLCRTDLSADNALAGQQMRCPNCLTAVTVPMPEPESVAAQAEPAPAKAQVSAGPTATTSARSAPPAIAPPPPVAPPIQRPPPTQYGKRYGFNCVYCSSRLEATETMAGHEGQCPTCGNAIVIPIMDRYGRLIDPVTKEIIKQDPHPVHAYAAAGERAPAIIRDENGIQMIVCAKCRRASPISVNNCKHCSVPFTMEGTAPEAAGAASGFATASLVLGIIGVPFFCTVIVPLLAIVFGGVALSKLSEDKGGRGQAIAGVVCGVVGVGIALIWYGR